MSGQQSSLPARPRAGWTSSAPALTFGRQSLYITQAEYAALYPAAPPEPVVSYADNFLISVGAQKLDTIDVSDYPEAHIIHDLNLRLVADRERR